MASGWRLFCTKAASALARLRHFIAVPDLPDELGTPTFLHSSGAGRFKDLDPSYPSETVINAWVPGAKIVCVGKAGSSLRRRIREFVDFGFGKRIGHRGGRMLWHLKDHRELIIRWQVRLNADDADKQESSLIDSFRTAKGKRPFANRLK
jgi:hypothetical protein